MIIAGDKQNHNLNHIYRKICVKKTIIIVPIQPGIVAIMTMIVVIEMVNEFMRETTEKDEVELIGLEVEEISNIESVEVQDEVTREKEKEVKFIIFII